MSTTGTADAETVTRELERTDRRWTQRTHDTRTEAKKGEAKRRETKGITINIYITHMNIETYKGHKDWSPELNMQTYAAIAEDPNILV
mgnify:CR=1 FL=1